MTLNKAEIESFKKRLLDLREQHQTALDGAASEVKTPDDVKGSAQHHADGGTDEFERTIRIEVSEKELEIIKQIDRSLEKIEEGTYGSCDVTGENIPMKRLEAIPYATMTRDVQDKMEKGEA